MRYANYHFVAQRIEARRFVRPHFANEEHIPLVMFYAWGGVGYLGESAQQTRGWH